MPVPRAVEPPRVEGASVVPAFVVEAVDEPVLVSDALLVDPPDTLVASPGLVEGLVPTTTTMAMVRKRSLVTRKRRLVMLRRLTR